jgi:hypothetical protein
MKKSKCALQKILKMSNGMKKYKDFFKIKIHYYNFMNFFYILKLNLKKLKLKF